MPRSARNGQAARQLGWRNSITAAIPGGSPSANAASNGSSYSTVGGHWNSTGPSRSPSTVASSMNARTSPATSRSRRTCVIR